MKKNHLINFCKKASESYRKKSLLKKIYSGVLPVIAMSAFMTTILYWNSRNYGLVLAYGGKEIATVENEEMYEKANQMLREQINSEDLSDSPIACPEYKLTVIDHPECSSPYEVKDKIIEQSQEIIEEAAGIYSNGKFVGAVANEEDAHAILKRLLESPKLQDENCQSEFVENVEVIKGLYLTSDVIEVSELETLLSEGKMVIGEYFVNENETISDIAKKFGMSEETLKEDSDITEDSIKFGNTIYIKSKEKITHIKTTSIENKDVEIPHSSVRQGDPNNYVGWEKIDIQGKNGLERSVYKVTYVDGIETDRENIENIRVSDPVDEHILFGTKKKDSNKKDITSNKKDATPQNVSNKSSSNALCWPVPYTKNVTSEYGQRDGKFHKGIDIASSGVSGKNIVASANGVVQSVSSGSSYGNYVKISHGNNNYTVYAHCMSISVRPGQTVSQGQVIATVGSTGDSTGDHLHFEVIVNGQHHNPREYV